jgi:hypothetical protein
MVAMGSNSKYQHRCTLVAEVPATNFLYLKSGEAIMAGGDFLCPRWWRVPALSINSRLDGK